MAPIAAVAAIALDLHHGLGDLDRLLRGSEPERIGQPRIGILLAVRPPEPAAHQHVEPGEPAAVRYHQEAQIVAVHVAAVVVRERDRDLELAWQVARSVDGLGLRRAFRHLLPVEPDLVIRPRSGEQVIGEATGQLEHLAPQAAGEGRRARHHVAHHVAAGTERGDEDVVQSANRRLQIALHHAVELVVLARGHAQRAVAVAVGQVVEREVLLGREEAARDLAADHELVRRLLRRAPPLPPAVAVLLLVAPVKLEELGARPREVGRVGRELGGQIASQAPAPLLHLLDRAQGLIVIHRTQPPPVTWRTRPTNGERAARQSPRAARTRTACARSARSHAPSGAGGLGLSRWPCSCKHLP